MYLFTGSSNYLIQEGYKKWKSQFIQKYGDFNCVDIKEPETLELNILAENLLSTSFLAEKKLVILHLDSKMSDKLQNFLLEIIHKIPEVNIVLFVYPQPDKRKKLYKELKKSAEVKEFELQSDQDNFNYFQTKYKGAIDDQALRTLIQYKSNHSSKIDLEIKKFLINNDTITVELIKEQVIPEFEENIFKLINDILYNDKKSIQKSLDTILNDTSIYALYNSLLANLRTHLYIKHLQKEGVSSIDSILKLGNRKFLLNKNYPISYDDLFKKFVQLVEIDKKMKTGKLLGSDDIYILYEIEKILLM